MSKSLKKLKKEYQETRFNIVFYLNEITWYRERVNDRIVAEMKEEKYWADKITDLRKTYPALIKAHNRAKSNLKNKKDRKAQKNNKH